ncbi:hypothetical protein B0T10DRAFT_218023 [Thelonectria olida]|uniref:Uncharacterized protein n=1 Tax=Thelonectria olida TaxID=1576542 RepID=A0A9P8WE86_9HYPO|nr:hypothetical protein B0T10DRAFT_218023 [Thelonectria olida]
MVMRCLSHALTSHPLKLFLLTNATNARLRRCNCLIAMTFAATKPRSPMTNRDEPQPVRPFLSGRDIRMDDSPFINFGARILFRQGLIQITGSCFACCARPEGGSTPRRRIQARHFDRVESRLSAALFLVPTSASWGSNSVRTPPIAVFGEAISPVFGRFNGYNPPTFHRICPPRRLVSPGRVGARGYPEPCSGIPLSILAPATKSIG